MRLTSLRLHHCGILSAALFTACAGTEVETPPSQDAGFAAVVDAGHVDAGEQSAPSGILELGVGYDAFAGVASDQSVGLTRGAQGLQHVWVAVRIRSMSPARAVVSLRLTRDNDGLVVSQPYRVRLPFSTHEGYAERVGMQLVVPDPNAVLGQYVTLSGEVENAEGVKAEAATHVLVFWEDQL